MQDRTTKLLSRGRLPQALSELEEACEDPDLDRSSRRCQMLSELSFHNRDLEKVRVWSNQALEIQPDSATALHHAALAAWNLHDPRAARSLVRKCLDQQPGHQGALDLFQLLDADHRPCRPATREKIKRLRKKRRPLTVRIHSHSDKETDPEIRLLWGDHWVRQELGDALSGLGFDLGQGRPDINIHLFGTPARGLDEQALNMVWLHSHPDMATTENLRPFDCIFCASSHFLPTLAAMGYLNIELMPACTSKTPVQTEILHDMIFLGNARESRPDGRAIVGDMLATGLDFKVWGNLWEGILPHKHYGGRYWDYERLAELYAASKITLNDHHPDMEREGFVSNKVFDILASGGFAISGKNKGLIPLFEDAVPEYDSPANLREIVEFYLAHPEKRQHLMGKGQKIAVTHTYAERARQLTRALIA